MDFYSKDHLEDHISLQIKNKRSKGHMFRLQSLNSKCYIKQEQLGLKIVRSKNH